MRTRLSIAAAVAALAAGCATATEQAPSNNGQAIVGRVPSGAYEVIDIVGAGRPSGDHAQIKLTFGPETLTVATGCNTLSGQTRLDGERLTVSEVKTTDLPCAEPFRSVQQWLAAFFDGRPTVVADQDQLTLATTQATIRLRPAGAATAPGASQPANVPRTAAP